MHKNEKEYCEDWLIEPIYKSITRSRFPKSLMNDVYKNWIKNKNIFLIFNMEGLAYVLDSEIFYYNFYKNFIE